METETETKISTKFQVGQAVIVRLPSGKKVEGLVKRDYGHLVEVNRRDRQCTMSKRADVTVKVVAHDPRWNLDEMMGH